MNRFTLAAASLILSCTSVTALAADLQKGSRAFDKQNYETAREELAPLAREGNPDAALLLGQMYEKGLGVEQDEARARELYDQGAAQGHLPSVNALRALKNKEYLVELKTVQPKADQGDAQAQNRLGEMFEFGQGVDRNAELAHAWYLKAADQGYVPAQHNLGRCYNFGTGVEQDFAIAEQWYRKAAQQGHVDAMFFLGTLYATEHGSDTGRNNNVEAYAWLHNSAELGNPTAQAIEKRLLIKLENDGLKDEALTLAQQYKDQYVTPFK